MYITKNIDETSITKNIDETSIIKSVETFAQKAQDEVSSIKNEFAEIKKNVNSITENSSNEILELKKSIGKIEAKIEKGITFIGGKEQEERVAVNTFLKALAGGFYNRNTSTYGKCDLVEESVRKFINTKDDVQGGYLVYPAIERRILERINLVSRMREVAEVVSLGEKYQEGTMLESRPVAYFTDELEAATESQPEFSRFAIYKKKITGKSIISDEMIRYADQNENYFIDKLAQAIAKKEGNSFLFGNGGTQFNGILSTANLAKIVSLGQYVDANTNATSADYLTWEKMIEVQGVLPDDYAESDEELVYIMSRQTWIKSIKKFADGTNFPLAREFFTKVGNNWYFDGYRIVIMPDMPVFSNDANINKACILFGNFKMSYRVIDEPNSTSILIDPYTQANIDAKVLYVRRRSGGGNLFPAFAAIRRIANA